MKALRFLLFFTIFWTSAAIAAGNASLTLRFSGGSLTAEGVTPGGKAVVFACSVERIQTQPALYGPQQRLEFVADDDRDGSITIQLPPNATAGIWAVADLSSGRYALEPTPGYEPERILLSTELLQHDNAGQLRKLQWPFAEMDALLVRPREGAWQLYASKGSGRDENRARPEALRIDVESMTAVGDAGAAPRNFKQGDVVIVFNPQRMQYGVWEVGK